MWPYPEQDEHAPNGQQGSDAPARPQPTQDVIWMPGKLPPKDNPYGRIRNLPRSTRT